MNATFVSKAVTITCAVPTLARSRPTPIGIWLGAYGPKAIELTGRAADGWVPSFRGELAPIVDRVHRLDDAIGRAGRHQSEVRRILNIGGTITDGSSKGPFQGPADQWVEELTDLAIAHGFDTFVLWAEGDGQLERFAESIAPEVRADVAAKRAP